MTITFCCVFAMTSLLSVRTAAASASQVWTDSKSNLEMNFLRTDWGLEKLMPVLPGLEIPSCHFQVLLHAVLDR